MHFNVRKTHKRSFLRTTIHVRATSTFCGSASSQARRADVESPRRRVSRPLPASARKFDYERSCALLESYYRVRAQHAEVFHQLTSSSVEHVSNDGVAHVMQKSETVVVESFIFVMQ